MDQMLSLSNYFAEKIERKSIWNNTQNQAFDLD